MNKYIDYDKKISKKATEYHFCEDKSRHKEKNRCIDCNKEVTKNSKRCCSCKNKLFHKEDNRCINCGKKITKRAKRCRLCTDELQRKEKNRCIDCNKEVTKNSKRCRACSNKIRHKKANKCIDCGKKISKRSKRCKPCANKYFCGKNSNGWKNGKPRCIDCNREISRNAKRCCFCEKKRKCKKENKCIDCNEILKYNSKRCSRCHYIYICGKNNPSWKGGWPKCIDCGKRLKNRNAKRCKDCAIKKLFKTIGHKKNKPEKFVEKLLSRTIPKEYKYVGNGKFWIERYNPDFINVNGQKKIIEFFGDYWHTTKKGCKQKDRRKIRTYKKYGYDCLIIRTKDLKSKYLENRILNFNKLGDKYAIK